MKTIKKKILLSATMIIAVSVGNFTATSDTMQMTPSNIERVATNPFTFEPILKLNLTPNVPQGNDDDKEEGSDNSETTQPVVIDNGTLT